MYWMVAFKIHVSDASLFEETLNRSSSEIWESFLSWIFFPILCPRVSSIHLNNLDSEVGLDVIPTTANWIKSILKIVPKFVLTKVTKTLGLLTLKIKFKDGLINFKILLLKAQKVSKFLIFKSKLFHSMAVDGKKEFIKK